MMMPVIKEIIVKQRSSDNILFLALYPHFLQFFVDCQAAARHADAVAVHGNSPVLDTSARTLKIIGPQNIPPFSAIFHKFPAPCDPALLFFPLPGRQFLISHDLSPNQFPVIVQTTEPVRFHLTFCN